MKYYNCIIKLIETITFEEASEVLFSIGHMSHETMKKKFKTKILNKIKVSSLSEMKSKNYEYLSEFITNIIIIKERKGKSVLYKPLDSTGYDGAFVIKSDV